MSLLSLDARVGMPSHSTPLANDTFLFEKRLGGADWPAGTLFRRFWRISRDIVSLLLLFFSQAVSLLRCGKARWQD
jgi:hypothetical protein